MLAAGDTRDKIADGYGVTPDQLDEFIRRHGDASGEALAPVTAGELSEEELKIQAFIAKRGVTKCPGSFTLEMVALTSSARSAD